MKVKKNNKIITSKGGKKYIAYDMSTEELEAIKETDLKLYEVLNKIKNRKI